MKENFSIVIVGHIDHGKSTLIGRLLYDSKTLPPDKVAEVEKITKQKGVDFQFAYLMDHLKEERDKNITIDTAQTFFKTNKRDYVIIDAPGHKEFIKNMITGASIAEAAVILIDAKEGIKDQTLRHTYLLNMLGIKQVIVLINKMDLVNYSQHKYNELVSEYKEYIKKYSIEPLYYIPVSAYYGDNVFNRSNKMTWYKSKIFIEALESFRKYDELNNSYSFYMVQGILNRQQENIVVGKLEVGTLHKNDKLIVLPSGEEVTLQEIKEFGKDEIVEIKKGSTAGLVFNKPIVQRGDIITYNSSIYHISYKLVGTIFWFSDKPLIKGIEYKIAIGTQETNAVVKKISSVFDSDNFEKIRGASDYIDNLEVGIVEFELSKELVYTRYRDIPELGRFVIDKDEIPYGGGIIE